MDKMISVNRDRLVFARENYGFSLQEVASTINKKFEVLQKWENGEDYPSYAQLSSLADYYNQPLFFFFMNGKPQKSKMAVAYRSIEKSSGTSLSKKVKEMMEKAEIYKFNLIELYDGQDVSVFSRKIQEDNINVDKLAQWLREQLNLSLKKQKEDFYKTTELIEYLRKQFYNIGVYIFKDTFKDNSVSGLCLYDDKFPVILLNNKTTFNRQLFTIFHELYHLFCKEADVDFSDKNEELACDKFASEFLIPENDFSNQIVNVKNFENHELISKLANLYTVSEDAVMFRLFKKRLISNKFYNDVREGNIRKMNSESSGGNFYYTRMSYLGKPYLNKVFDMYYSGNISVSKVGTFMQLKATHVSKLASNMYGGGF